LKIEKIEIAYRDSVRLTTLPKNIRTYPHISKITDPGDVLNYPANINTTRLITYFKLLPEFVSLNENDKLIQTKYNMHLLLFFRSAINYDPLLDHYHEPNTDEFIFNGRDLIECFSLHQYQESTRCVLEILDASNDDMLIIRIFLIILIFSKGPGFIYSDEVEPIAEDILGLLNRQNIYVDLLWRYCEEKYGLRRSTIIWMKLITACMDSNLQASLTRQNYIKVETVALQLVPLMKSVMLV